MSPSYKIFEYQIKIGTHVDEGASTAGLVFALGAGPGADVSCLWIKVNWKLDMT